MRWGAQADLAGDYPRDEDRGGCGGRRSAPGKAAEAEDGHEDRRKWTLFDRVGKAKVVKLSLNATGKKLLRMRRRLPAMLEITGSATLSKKLTFIYKPPHLKKH